MKFCLIGAEYIYLLLLLFFCLLHLFLPALLPMEQNGRGKCT